MPPRKRTATPGPRTPGPRELRPTSGPAMKARAHQQAGSSSAAGAALGHGEVAGARAGARLRRHTDRGCLLAFLAFTGFLAAIGSRSRAEGDVRRLTYGFDFRGRLCGSSTMGLFTHWCSHDGRVRWDFPVCVQACPTGGEQIMCPLSVEESVETTEHLRNGSVLLVKTSKQLMVPRIADSTNRRWQFCIPEGIEPATVTGVLPDVIVRELGHVVGLMTSPRILILLVCLAMASAVVWIVLLSVFTRALLHSHFILGGLSLVACGVLVLAAGTDASRQLAEWISKVPEERVGNCSRVAHVMVVLRPILRAAADSFAQVIPSVLLAMRVETAWTGELVTAWPLLQMSSGIICILLGIAILLWHWVSRDSLSAAADCTQEACYIVLKSPALLLLPVFDTALHAGVLVGAAVGLASLLATAELKPSSITILGETVVGIGRSIEWTGELVAGTLCWLFAFLWYSEMVTAVRSFLLSYTAVSWYFRPDSGCRCWFPPIVTGIFAAAFYHLGSLALGSFVMAFLRAAQWFFIALNWLVGERKENRWSSRCCCFGLFHVLVAMAKAFGRHVSGSAYTDLVINSSSLTSASWDAAALLANNAGLVVIRSFLLRPVMLLGSVAYVVGFGWCIWALLIVPPEGTDTVESDFWQQMAAERARLESPVAAAVSASVLAFAVVREFTAVVDEIANAILYCFLWDKSDGVFDAKLVPPSFRALVGKMASAH